jgi:hypothetical protein
MGGRKTCNASALSDMGHAKSVSYDCHFAHCCFARHCRGRWYSYLVLTYAGVLAGLPLELTFRKEYMMSALLIYLIFVLYDAQAAIEWNKYGAKKSTRQ